MRRRKFLKNAATLGAAVAVAATIGLPLAQAQPDRYRRRQSTTTTSQVSTSSSTSTQSSPPANSPNSVPGMMALMYENVNTSAGQSNWSALEAALAQPGVSNVPVLVVVTPGLSQQYPSVQAPMMIALKEQYPQVSYMTYIDACGGSNYDGCTYVPLETAESLTLQVYDWYNTVQSYNPTGIRLLEGNFYDDADWVTNNDGLSSQEYFSELQAYAESLGMPNNMGNTGDNVAGVTPNLQTCDLIGTLPYWNIWEDAVYPTVTDLTQFESAGAPPSTLAWINHGVPTFSSSAIEALWPNFGWAWVVPTRNDGGYDTDPYVSQLLSTLGELA
jgi:hypothetical protein